METALNQETILKLIENQKTFFRSQKTKDLSFRKDGLRRLKRAVRDKERQICEALWTDLHKSAQEAYITEISIVLEEIDYHLRHMERWISPRRVPTPLFMFGSRSRIIYEPYGTALIVSPWNYPFQLLINPLVGALSAGNCAVLKPSPQTPAVNRIIAELIAEIFPSEYVAVVEGDLAVYHFLLAQPFDYLFFTGSPAAGRIVMSAAAQHLTPITLELGGKSPCIADWSANIDIAARRIAWGKFLNAGQTCVAPDYLFVHKSIRDRLTERIVYYIRQFYGENPQESPDYPRMVSEAAAERLKNRMQGETVIYGGNVDIPDKYIAPTLIAATPENAFMRDEIFGPVLPVLEFDELNQVVEYINNGEKPLALYYFGEKKTAKQLIGMVSSGGTCINDVVMHLGNPRLPFGGVGNSGMGKYHGRYSFETFSHERAILQTSLKIDFPIKYAPYKPLRVIKKLMRL